MTYLDSSVALAELFAEDRHPAAEFWEGRLFSSRLLEYEVCVRLQARQVEDAVSAAAHELLAPIVLAALTPAVLERALEPFPARVRTLDALHLATAHYLRQRGHVIEIASYDRRLCQAAQAMGFAILNL